MQQFTVPQFIDVEDKIIGPITTRQFIIMLSASVIIAICYKIFDFELFVMIGIMILAVAGTFAFLKINGRPFHFFVLNLVETLKRPAIRIWSNADKTAPEFILPLGPKPGTQAEPRRTFTHSRLSELSLVVDTHGAYRGNRKDEENIMPIGEQSLSEEIDKFAQLK